MCKWEKIKNYLPTIGILLMVIGILLATTGPDLYVAFLIPVLLVFLLVFKIIIRHPAIKRIDRKIELALIFTMVLLTFVQVWLTMYNNASRIYTIGVVCSPNLILDTQGTSSYHTSFGNFGVLPGLLHITFIKNTGDMTIIGQDHIDEVLVPVNFQNNNQTPVDFQFRINTTNSSKIGFTLKFIFYGDDLLSKDAGFIKQVLGLYNYQQCNYTRFNSTLYILS
jgi:hypothetical protein